MAEKFKNLKEVELSNWIGKAYIGERKHIEILKKFEDSTVPGVYFLISDIENSYQKKYILEKLTQSEKD